jgi:hypothetical protein
MQWPAGQEEVALNFLQNNNLAMGTAFKGPLVAQPQMGLLHQALMTD